MYLTIKLNNVEILNVYSFANDLIEAFGKIRTNRYDRNCIYAGEIYYGCNGKLIGLTIDNMTLHIEDYYYTYEQDNDGVYGLVLNTFR
jgi:hypothetical protein